MDEGDASTVAYISLIDNFHLLEHVVETTVFYGLTPYLNLRILTLIFFL